MNKGGKSILRMAELSVSDYMSGLRLEGADNQIQEKNGRILWTTKN